ncbi:MAG: LpxD N-terminal domain-containing protein, partial [Candidatus Berkiellales bacterium]
MKLIPHRATLRQTNKFSLGKLAELTQASLKGDPTLEISGVGTLTHAKKGEIAFLANAKYRNQLSTTPASAVIVTQSDVEECPTAALIVSDPKLVFAKVVQLLYPQQIRKPGQHSSVIVGEHSEIDPQSY